MTIGSGHPAAGAPRPVSWSPRERIPGINDDARTPYLVADHDRTVHAFHSQPARADASKLAIVYNRWTLQSGWTLPTDIILPPFRGQASVLGAFLDRHGIVHIVFFSGDDAVANMYYARGWAARADQVDQWWKPQLIGDGAIVPRSATITGDAQGNLLIIYSGKRQGVGWYAVRSTDRGDTWSEPVAFFRVDRADLQPWADYDLRPWDVQAVADDAGRLHVTWVVVGRDGNGKAIYYASTALDSTEWSAPHLLATVRPNGYEVDWPSIAAYQGDLLLIYNDYKGTRRVMRASTDGGRTWQDPFDVLAPTGGEYGNASFATDGAGVLHVVFGDRARGLNLWHSVWQDGRWQEPEPIAPPAEASTYPKGPLEFHPSHPRVVVSQGNVLLTVWSTDPGEARNGTWYAYKLLDVPELPREALPLPTWQPSTPLLVGILPMVLLIVALRLWRLIRRSPGAGAVS